MAQNGALTAKQRGMIASLVSSRTVGEAIKAAGVPASTLLRWRRQPEFAAALREAEAAVWRDGLRLLLADQQQNLYRIMELREKGDGDAVRLRAAVALESAIARRHDSLLLEDLAARLSALEAGQL